MTTVPKKNWKGFAIIGNGNMCAVYSDDYRSGGKGVQHFYFNDYTCNYISSSWNDLYQGSTKLTPLRTEIGNSEFFSTSTKSYYQDSLLKEVNCYAYPELGIILSVKTSRHSKPVNQKTELDLVKSFASDKTINLRSIAVKNGKAVAEWSNNVIFIIGSKNPDQLINVEGSKITFSGTLNENKALEILIVPAFDVATALKSWDKISEDGNIFATSKKYWNNWINTGVLPNFPQEDVQYTEYYKRNLYCVKSALLNGKIPADITGQFVTNNMPQLYPRDEMMCARVLLLTGHSEEAKSIISLWAKKDIPEKSKGEWFARYDANGRAVNGGSGARYDVPEWDANGYFIQLVKMYYDQNKEWLAGKDQIYRLADFLVSKIDTNNLLYEGGIIEWPGYLPGTNMVCSAGLLTASEIAESFGDEDKALIYRTTSKKIAGSLNKMYDRENRTYADLRFDKSKDTTFYQWDTSLNFGLIWGYPNHKEILETNKYFLKTTFKLDGGVQYFDSYTKSADYGHGCFFFTTAASAQYQALYGNPQIAKYNIDWMINNSNIYGLMPERIYPDNSDCSPATPLSWCSAEFSAALLYYSKAIKQKNNQADHAK